MVATEPRVRPRHAKLKRMRCRDTSAIRVSSVSDGQELFDYQARKALNLSGEEFLRRWDAGMYRSDSSEEGMAARRLALLIPFIRRIEV